MSVSKTFLYIYCI